MKCIYCDHNRTEVVETRESSSGTITRRRRACPECERRFTTYEKAEKFDLVVIKKKGATENFDKEKILGSLFKACKGQDIANLTIINLTDQVEQELLKLRKPEVKTDEIARIILKKLHELDEVAFIRYASYQYRVDSIDELRELRQIALENLS